MNKSSESSSASATNTKSDEGCDSSIEKKCIERTACNAAPTNPMEALLSAIKNRNGASKEKKPSIAANVEFSPGVNRLQMFLQGAKKEMSQLDSVRDQALNANRVSLRTDLNSLLFMWSLAKNNFCCCRIWLDILEKAMMKKHLPKFYPS